MGHSAGLTPATVSKAKGHQLHESAGLVHSVISSTVVSAQGEPTTGHAPVNGLEMYYEVHGSGGGLQLPMLQGSVLRSAGARSRGKLICGPDHPMKSLDPLSGHALCLGNCARSRSQQSAAFGCSAATGLGANYPETPMRNTLIALTFTFTFTIAACVSSSDETEPPATFAEQVAHGRTLFAENCAKCHGDSGQGTEKAPRLVGLKEGALPLDPPASRKVRKTRFVTVGDVAKFAMENMPPKKAGTLTTDEYLAVIAFDLKANGIDLGRELLTMAKAKTLTIPR